MKIEPYYKRLQKLYAMDFPENQSQPPEGVSEFLDLSAMRLLLGNDITPLKHWLEKYQQRTPITGRPVAEFFRLTRLATVEILFGEDGKANAEKACEILPVAIEQSMFETDVAFTIQKALGLAMFFEDIKGIMFWRKKRLEMPVVEGWETSSFEIAYLSSEEAEADDFENLANAAARVSVKVLLSRAQDSIAPLMLALNAHCRSQGKSLADVLENRVLKLDERVFSDSIPKIEIVNKIFRYRKDDGKDTFEIRVRAKGSGNLSTGDYEIEPLTSDLAPVLFREFKRPSKKAAIREVLDKPENSIRCSLKLDDGVTMSVDQISSLERRMNVGYQWAEVLIGKIKAAISLDVQ